MSDAWFSSMRTPTKRIEGLVTASQIPAASAASFFCLRRVEDGGGLGQAATLASAEGLAERHVRRLVPLAFLSPRSPTAPLPPV